MNGVGEVGRPVSVAEIDRKLNPEVGKFGLERFDQSVVLIVDGRATAKLFVLLGDNRQSLVWDVSARGYVAKERQYIVGTIGSTKAQNTERIKPGGAYRYGDEC